MVLSSGFREVPQVQDGDISDRLVFLHVSLWGSTCRELLFFVVFFFFFLLTTAGWPTSTCSHAASQRESKTNETRENMKINLRGSPCILADMITVLLRRDPQFSVRNLQICLCQVAHFSTVWFSTLMVSLRVKVNIDMAQQDRLRLGAKSATCDVLCKVF